MNQPIMASEDDIVRMAVEHLPNWVKACSQDAPLVIINQKDFSTSDEDMLRLAVSIKYAGIVGKNVTVVL